MSEHKLFEAYQRAQKEALATEEAEAEARLKRVKARRAVEAAEDAYSKAFDAHHRATQKSMDAYSAWQEAKAAEVRKAGA